MVYAGTDHAHDAGDDYRTVQVRLLSKLLTQQIVGVHYVQSILKCYYYNSLLVII